MSANPCETDAGRINKYHYTGCVGGSFWNFIRFRDFRKRCKISPSSSLNLKASFVQPLSLASARQLSWQESPWQRGFVFDETDLRLLENVTECQSLSLWERWHGEAVTERARMLTKNKKHSDTSPVCQRHRIAALSCFILPGLPSQALTRQLSQRASPWQRGFVLRKHF